MIKGIIFDMDGVLAQTSEIHRQAFELVLKENGINDFFDYSQYAGMKTRSALMKFFSDIGLKKTDAEVKKISQEKSNKSQVLMREIDYISNGAFQLLNELKNEFKISIASSGSPSSVQLFVQKYKLEKIFDVVISSGDVEHAKPHPEIFLKAVDKLGLKNTDCIVIEDSTSGIKAAQAAQIQVIAIEGTTPKNQLQELFPLAIIKSLEEIKRYL